jgi:hypothetical protein
MAAMGEDWSEAMRVMALSKMANLVSFLARKAAMSIAHEMEILPA